MAEDQPGTGAGDAGAEGGGDAKAGFLTPIEPERLASSPYRNRLERGAKSKGYRIFWYRDRSEKFCGLRLIAYDREWREVRRMGFAKLASHYDEAIMAEDICEWILNPRLAPPVSSGSYR